MADDFTSCQICGAFVLQVPGWTALVESYTLLRATWRPGASFFQGALHLSCLTDWEHRDAFLAEFRTIMTGYGRSLTVEAGGTPHTVRQPGYHYGERVLEGESCDIFRHTGSDRWLVLTEEGPWYTLGPEQLAALAEGRPAWFAGGGERVRLPADVPGEEVPAMDLAGLLGALGSAERYPGLWEAAPDYEVWRYGARKRVLEYSVSVRLPLPREATEFLSDYARAYEPIVLED
ncbi:hypothetical protein SAMN06297387_103161 [Streptomyces zhaozhouensis]|uniref:Uncharacterized protein n=1 Tax=Streptomyces zhaozhouensis TaxID=1300267 RepID=A0A286DS93_9ACTN|nr:hypothetical protein [Streptomyces zhaozhouensis]SOD61424.1 hypothetical protein SAMN06297387_103161 [Streptomyces zhaozhouensis]